MIGELDHANLTERQRQVFEAVKAGLTKQEIAEKLDLTHQRVSQLCSRLGLVAVSIKDKRRELKAKIKDMTLAGMSVDEISKTLGIGVELVYNFRSQVGMSQSQQVADRREKVAELLKAGLNAAEVAQIVASTRARIEFDKEVLGLTKTLPETYSDARSRQKIVKALMSEGKTIGEMAALLNVSYGTISNDARALKLPQSILLDIAQLSTEGLPIDEIAERLHIARWAARAGVYRLKTDGAISPKKKWTKKDPTKAAVSPETTKTGLRPVSLAGDICCPNSDCQNHTKPQDSFYRKKGNRLRKCDGKLVQRYQCRSCGKYFNATLLHPTRGEHRPELNAHIERLLAQGWPQRKIARALRCSKLTVWRKVRKIKANSSM